jgi:adenylate kinase
MRIVLLGAPGSGKGTQSQLLVKAYGIPQISTGDLLRQVRAQDNDLGRKVRAIMDLGKLVDDATVLAMIRERLGKADAAKGFILDGFPRNIPQAEALANLLKELGTPLDAVVLLNLDLKILFTRLTGRRTCNKCKKVFNIYTSPPSTNPDGTHADDGGLLEQREDDKEAVIGERLDVFEKQTKPLIKFYTDAALLRVVDADAAMDTVFKSIQSAVESKGNAAAGR